ncbi:glycosyltransferase [Demequina soli]|uniref:glycosyltransferase n=1 Tax=Demequina soli TaxID=1638987 RepID=UPI0014724AF7|nr:glycosyltransferase [Demequina soli]
MTTVVIVCPTARGGHIEHAADIAAVLERNSEARVVVLSRPGAADYLASLGRGDLIVDEILPDLSPIGGIRGKLRNALGLFVEAHRLRHAVRDLQPAVVVAEEPRYAFRGELGGSRRDVRLVTFVHNARPHAGDSEHVVRWAKSWLMRRTISMSDAIVVHGMRQAKIVAHEYDVEPIAVSLPNQSVADNPPPAPNPSLVAGREERDAFLCLGEIRTNKGIELAIRAARASELPLRIVGKAPERAYLDKLMELASGATHIEIIPNFLSPDDFQRELTGCRAVLLPYAQFDAHSGVLARAMAAGIAVLAADLPALVEQTGEYGRIAFFRAGDSQDLSRLMTDFLQPGTLSGESPRPGNPSPPAQPWEAIVGAILGN